MANWSSTRQHAWAGWALFLPPVFLTSDGFCDILATILAAFAAPLLTLTLTGKL
jgi:hypothetical protein